MSDIPSKQQLLDWIKENPTKTNKREIARAFNIKGAARIDLKRLLKELTAEGHLQKNRKAFRGSADLPPVLVLSVARIDSHGDLWAQPVDWRGDDPAPPRRLRSVHVAPQRRGSSRRPHSRQRRGSCLCVNGLLTWEWPSQVGMAS